MRIITGSARGTKLESPAGETTRPTSDRVKEAVFSVLQFDIEGSAVLDLFAGSGQMGIEALSRGASEAVFVDNRRESVEIIKRNLASVKLDHGRVVQSDSISFLNSNRTEFDFMFLDPPYGTGLLQAAKAGRLFLTCLTSSQADMRIMFRSDIRALLMQILFL